MVEFKDLKHIMKPAWLLLVSLMAVGQVTGLARETCSVQSNGVDILPNAGAQLGGLVAFSQAGSQGFGCGQPALENLPAYEAILWALNKTNQNSGRINTQVISDSYIPGVQVGLQVRDTCSMQDKATKSAQDLFPELAFQSKVCTKSNAQLMFGMLGSSYSSTAAPVASLLGPAMIPQISYQATAPSLSDKGKYPSFLRTIPPDNLQIEVIMQLLKTLQWTYIAVVYTTDTYGAEGFEALRKMASKEGICINIALKLKADESRDSEFKKLTEQLVQRDSINGVVYFGLQPAAAKLAKAARGVRNAGRLQWIFPDSIGTSVEFAEQSAYLRGMLTITPKSREIPEFEDHWVSLNPESPSSGNPWYKEWFMTANKCKLSGVNYAPYNTYQDCQIKSESERRKAYVQNQYVEPAIHAVYSYLKALKNAHKDRCGGRPGVCSQLLGLSSKDFYDNYLKNVDFTYSNEERIPTLASARVEPYRQAKRVRFGTSGSIEDPAYEIFNYNYKDNRFQFVSIGNYFNNRLDINKAKIQMYDNDRVVPLSPLPTSGCPSASCEDCVTAESDLKFAHLSGDIMINGLFSVHKGDQCGQLKSNGVQLLESFLYAVKKIRDRAQFPNILKGVTLGAIGFDDCNSLPKAQDIVLDFQYEGAALKDGTGSDIDPKSVYAYAAAHSSSLTVAVAEILTKLKMPQIGYQSTSTELSNKNLFPYFARTCPADDKQVTAMIRIAKNLGWSYVQIVASAGSYGSSAVAEFKKQASAERICPAASLEVGTDGNMEQIVDKLREKPNAKAVFLFIDSSSDIKALLKSIEAKNASKEFILVGSEIWGSSSSIVADNKAAAQGAITLQLKSGQAQGFLSYLNGLGPSSYKDNPWFTEWYEATKKCYFGQSNPKKYPKACSTEPINVSNEVTQESYTPYVINAVYAFAHGLDATLKEYCGTSYNGVCSAFRADSQSKEKLLENIKKVAFTDELGQEFSFKDGEGASGYDIYNYQGSRYQKIGEYSIKDEQLKFNKSLAVKSVDASCPQVCGECLYLYQKQKYMYMPGDMFISSLINIHGAGSNPYQCGPMRVINGVQYTEILQYAVQKINKGTAPVSLNGVKLGALILDDCSSEMRAANLVSSLHLGGITLPDEEGKAIDMADSRSWLSYGSSRTMEAADILGKIGVLSISPSASSVLLADQTRFPTFYRTIPPDDLQASGMGDLCRSMGWTYVQTVNSPNVYGRTGVEAFKRYARTLNICVSGSYEQVTDGNDDTIISNLLTSTSQVVIVFGNLEYANSLLMAKAKNTKASGLVFIGTESWNNNTALLKGVESNAEGVITFKVSSPIMYDFVDYLSQKYLSNGTANPWFQEWYEDLFKCDAGYNTKYGKPCTDQSITTAAGFVPDIWATTTMEAIYATVEATDMALKQMCGTNYNGICAAVKQSKTNFEKLVVKNMEKVNFKDPSGNDFKFIKRHGNNPYEIFRVTAGKFKPVGSYSASGVLSLTDSTFKDSYPKTNAKCTGNCLECQYVFRKAEEYTFIPGDILLAGVFDVHKKGSNPFNCGEINKVYGFQLLEAFNYAIEYVNSKEGPFNGKLNGVTLGGLGLDACQSATRAGNLVANLHSGFLNLTSGPVPVNPNRIDAYIGAFASDMTVQIADVLSVLGIPQISYGSTSIELKNRRKFRHFLRTVPADDKQARAMIAILKRFNLQYVQVINSVGTYGEEAAAEFIRLARASSICVAQNITFGGSEILTDVAANDAVSKLLSKPSATVVITILKTADVHPFLAAVNRNPQARNKFMFLGSEGWADNMELIGRGVGRVAKGSVTLGMETADLSGFDNYLDSKFPGTYSKNPWFDEYYEAIFNCSLSPISAKIKYERQCTFTNQGVVRSPNYRQDPYVLYTVNAVLSAALGVHNAIVKKCGSNYNGLCETFRNSGERRQDILEGIKKAEFIDATKQSFAFNDNGEANRGYHLYNVQQSLANPNNYIYDNVGSYNDTHLLKVYSDFNIKWYSNCSKTGSCPECPLLGQQSSRYMQRLQPKEDLNIVGVFDVHNRGKDSFKCGEMRVNYGMQNLLAFFYSLERINKNLNLNLPPSLKLGGLALDACSSGMRTRRDLFSLLAGDGLCTVQDESLVKPDTVVTVLTMGSDSSLASLDVVQPIGIPTLSPSATSPTLNGKPDFLRAVPPDTLQAKVMAEIVHLFGWSYVSAVNVDNNYGNEGVNAFLEEIKNTNKSICLSTRIVLPLNLTKEQARAAVLRLDQQKGAKAVIVFVSREVAGMLLLATKELGLKDRFIWIGSDSWSDSMAIIKDVEDVARGAITIQIRSEEVSTFKQYVKELNLLNRKGIPDDWFEEFWQHMHQCRLHNSSVAQTQYSKVCTGYEIITDEKIKQDTYVLYTIISTYMVAQGINNIRECRDSPLGVAGCLSQLRQKYQRIYNGTKDAQWNVLPDEMTGSRRLNFKFTNLGFGDVGYSILNIQKTPNDTNKYMYKRIGLWMEKLELEKDSWIGYDDKGELDAVPASKCPADVKCACKTKGPSEPTQPRTGQLRIPQKNENFTIAYGIIVAALTALGILITIFLFIYLLIFYPVRGGTTVLGYFLIVGILLIYVLNFAFLYLPDSTICGARRFGQGFVYAICFSAMLLKVLNTWRVGIIPEYSVTYERLSHPCSLFLIALAMVSVQVIIAAEWLILVPPKVEFIEYGDMSLPRCYPTGFHNEELVLSCVYVMLLILITLIFAIVTWDSDDNHHESRWILITCCFTIGIWLVWTIVSTLTDIKYRDPAIAIGNLVNATVILLCIYVRKIYLLNKYQNELEEERRSQYAFSTSNKGDGYPNVFSNHIYDNTLDTGSRKGSTQEVDDSGVIYVYDGKRGDDIQY